MVTLGVFDGVHMGHQALIARAVAVARRQQVPAVAYTFDPHPAELLAKKGAPPSLMSVAERVRLLHQYGVEWVVTEPFDARFARLSADEWVEQYLVKQLHPRHVVVGFNFSYGQGRHGRRAHLEEAGRQWGYTVDVLGPVRLGEEAVSSSLIRAYLSEGALERASAMLGRPFSMVGEVVRGEGRGRRLGFPTANLRPDQRLLPKAGVYATRVAFVEPPTGCADPSVLSGGFDAVTNVGTRPTFDGRSATVETHVLSLVEGPDLYGARLRLTFVSRLRDERRFDGLGALRAQIQVDAGQAKVVLAAARGT